MRHHVQGIPFTRLAAEFGTPLYVYDGEGMAGRHTRLADRLNAEVFYSLKANPNVAVCALLASLGAGAEVSSLAELLTAERAGVAPSDIVFAGPGKSPEELAACLDRGIGAIICESLQEMETVDRMARIRGVRARVAIRVNPGFAVRSTTLAMSGKPRQFGIDEAALRAAGPALPRRLPHLDVVGFHVYMGTRILDGGVISENTVRILELAADLATVLEVPLELVDVGGGLGVPYFDGEAELDADALVVALNRAFATVGAGTRIIMELGRYLTAPFGTYLVRVRTTKESQGERFAVTDGGTHHHMAAVGIGSFVKRNFPMFRVDAGQAGETLPWTVAGPLCTPNDTLARNIALPPLRAGDLIGVAQSGAYGPTASPGLFLGHGYPAEVLVLDGVAHLVRDRDRPADLLTKQHLPTILAGSET